MSQELVEKLGNNYEEKNLKEQIELLEMHKDGIMVAEYCTELPPKKVLEEKLHEVIIETRERIEKKTLK